MKVCGNCKLELPLEKFNKKGPDRYQPYCRPCDNERSRAYYAKNREYHKAEIRKRSKKYLAESKAWIRNIKESSPCLDCGIKYPWYVMDFDHVSGAKVGNISEMIAKLSAKQKILDELDKCELVCSNCHRERTFQRMQN
jgi:hypothetical protein